MQAVQGRGQDAQHHQTPLQLATAGPKEAPIALL